MNCNYEDLEPIIGAALKSAKTANERIDALPLPMVFKGTLGTGGTISTLPTASSSNEGYVYIVITDGTYAGQSAKAGDTFVSDGSAWVLVPSADEPSPIDDSVTSTALTWSSDKIYNDLAIKSFTHIGDGNIPAVITFPEVPKTILSIEGQSGGSYLKSGTIEWGISSRALCSVLSSSYGVTTYSVNLSFDDDNKQLTIDGSTETRAFNTLDREYKIYYI